MLAFVSDESCSQAYSIVHLFVASGSYTTLVIGNTSGGAAYTVFGLSLTASLIQATAQSSVIPVAAFKRGVTPVATAMFGLTVPL